MKHSRVQSFRSPRYFSTYLLNVMSLFVIWHVQRCRCHIFVITRSLTFKLLPLLISGVPMSSSKVGQYCSIDDMFCIPANYSKFNPPLNPPGLILYIIMLHKYLISIIFIFFIVCTKSLTQVYDGFFMSRGAPCGGPDWSG